MTSIEARLANTEKALLALFTFLVDLQPPDTQDHLYKYFEDYFDAQVGLGMNKKGVGLITKKDLEAE